MLVAVVGVTAFPAEDGSSELGGQWLEAPLVGIVTAFDGELPADVVELLRVAVGLSSALILLMAITTSMSGCARLAHSMGTHGMLPREIGRFERRTLVSRETIAAITVVAIAVVLVGSTVESEAKFLASTYSFGVLLAFTLAQLAVIRLRRREPDLPRPFRARPDVRLRGVDVPLPALVGAPLTAAIFVLAMVTHEGARYAGPAWLALGLVVYAGTRWRARRGMLEDVDPRNALPVGMSFKRILVPMKLGDIGEEMVATAVALAKESGAQRRGDHRREGAAGAGARRAAPSGGRGAGRRLGRRGPRAGRGERRRRARGGRPRSLDRPRDRRRGDTSRRRPHRARLGAALATPVAVLLAHGRPRAATRAVRGARRRVPRRRPRGGVTDTRAHAA